MRHFIEDVKRLKRESNRIYIYGAGLYGQNIRKILKEEGICIDGYVVTKKGSDYRDSDFPIYEFMDVVSDDIGIIIGVNRHNAIDVKKLIEEVGFASEKVVSGTEYIDNNSVRGGYDEIPTIEITTRIGCRVNCKYCPQRTLVEAYYAENTCRDSVMTIDTFEKCLFKLPTECTILFSGMSEPFLNRNCSEMLKMACATGRKVDLYTTLEGTSMEDIDTILELPIDFVGLHVADKRQFASISTDEDYYKKVELLLNSKRVDGTNVIKVCNAQTEPDERIKKMCEGKYNVLSTMLDRAGNLVDEGLFRKKCATGNIACSLCGKKLNHNILLPDGTMLLCCMDYSMKHVLGNLLDSEYDEIMNGNEIMRIKMAMNEDGDDILCRRCSCANVV